MKILVIGDLHGKLPKLQKRKVKEIDLILLLGDYADLSPFRKIVFQNINQKKKNAFHVKASKTERNKVYSKNLKLITGNFKQLSKIAPIYFIFGNTELNDEFRKKILENVEKIKNVKSVNNKTRKFKSIKIGGLGFFAETDWVKQFKPDDKEMMQRAKKKNSEIKNILNKFNKLDILVSHIPPYRILDKVTAKFAPKSWKGKHAGSKLILNYIKTKKPKYVFCGHIHEAQGKAKLGKTEIYNLGERKIKIIEI